jgi:zeaxanthin epoxidase
MSASTACAPVAAALRAAAKTNAARSHKRAVAPRRGRAVQTRALTLTEDGQRASDAAKAMKPRDDLPEVLVAGGGIAGLITALALQRKGMRVKVFEKVKEYKLFGGPIQLQCNAQGALDSIAPDVLEQIWEKSTITGDRVNGLLDGVAGDWFYRFDTRQPCYNNGLPLTLVIARYDLLDILRNAVGLENIEMETVVASYEHVVVSGCEKVRAALTTGAVHEADVLIGADGIRSKIRAQMRNEDPENPPLAYAGYAVYTAICEYSQPFREPLHTDVERTGYQVFLGPKQYFVSSDVGDGQQQYYAFLDVPAGGDDEFAACANWENYRAMLLDRFGSWCPAVVERLEVTKPEDVERRDVYDVIPDFRWVDGRVALLGDSAHAVQPNLGQGGGQAIESAYALADELAKCEGKRGVKAALMKYTSRRFLRASSIHGLSRFSSLMNTVYRRYLGDEPYGFYPEPVQKLWHAVAKLRIPHPGSVVGQIALMGTMPAILEYVGGGFNRFGVPAVLGGASTGNGVDRVPRSQVPGVSAPKRDLKPDDFEMKGFPGLAK